MTAITNAWVYESGAKGFRRGEYVHVTDMGKGQVRSLRDVVSGLPDGWDNPDSVWHWHNSGAFGVINGEEVYISDKAETDKLHDAYPSLPSDWRDGITDTWVYESGAKGFRRGEYVHVTDLGKGEIRSLRDVISGLPDGWDNPDCVWHWQSSGAFGVINNGEVYISDKGDIEKLHDAYPSLPSDW
ncbi:hypothetical protein [Streptomyces anulatus]|uniref:PQQ-binding-like beta-propeller repeat protein n=1 Tax=Streptomyces anulatus TaxID=1892 RepID=A0ABZ1ZSK7_STRAQ|nr:hypothetical protein [Streptomyces anulatus]